MHKRERRGGGTDGRGRGKGDVRGDRRQQHGAGGDGQRKFEGKNGKNDGKGGKSGKSGKGGKDNPKMEHVTTVASQATGHVSAGKRREKGSRWGNGLPHWRTPRPKDYDY